MLNYLVIYSLPESASGCKHARNCVYLSKIENSSYHQKLVSHRMAEHFVELCNLVRIKLHQPLPDSFNQGCRVCIQFILLDFKSAAVFITVTNLAYPRRVSIDDHFHFKFSP